MLVLSLFPGIGLLDRAFEAEGFCVVRGPDLLWGGDIHAFHPPAGRFDGVIGGPPCQTHSSMGRAAKAAGQNVAPCLIGEFERCVTEAAPAWWLMENVKGAPVPQVAGYVSDPRIVNNRWCGGEQNRVRRFTLGTPAGRPLHVPGDVFLPRGYRPCVTANATVWDPVKKRAHGDKSRRYLRQAVIDQGLPADFDLPGFTVAGAIKAVGNGVPLPMGRAVARAVRAAMNEEAA